MLIKYAKFNSIAQPFSYNELKVRSMMHELPEEKKNELGSSYINDFHPQAKVISTNLPFAEQSDKLSAFRNLVPLVSRAETFFTHFKITFHHQDKVTDRRAWEIVQDFASEFEFDKTAYIAYRHYDEPHPHFHLVSARYKYDGEALNFDHLGYRLKAFCIRTEEKYDFVRHYEQGYQDKEKGVKLDNYYQRKYATERKPVSSYIREAFEESVKGKPGSLELFVERMARRNVLVQFRRFRTSEDKLKLGISYKIASTEPTYRLENPEKPHADLGLNISLNQRTHLHDKGWAMAKRGEQEVKVALDHFQVLHELPADQLAPSIPTQAYSTRSKRMGERYMWDSLKEIVGLKRIPSERVVNELNSFRLDEPENLTKMIVSLENRYGHGIEEAYDQGIRVNDIPQHVQESLPQDSLAFLENLTVIFSVEEAEKLEKEYIQAFGRISENSRELLYHTVRNDQPAMLALLEEQTKKKGADIADTRILLVSTINRCSEAVQQQVARIDQEIDEMVQTVEELRSPSQREQFELTMQFNNMLEEYEYKRALKFSEKIQDWRFFNFDRLNEVQDFHEEKKGFNKLMRDHGYEPDNAKSKVDKANESPSVEKNTKNKTKGNDLNDDYPYLPEDSELI